MAEEKADADKPVPAKEGKAGGEAAVVKDDLVAKVVLAKLDRIVIPVVDYENTSVEEALDFARVRMAEYDLDRKKPERMGVSFVIRRPKSPAAAEADGTGDDEGEAGLGAPVDHDLRRVTYHGKNVRILDLVTEIAKGGGVDAYVTSTGIILLPEGAVPDKGVVWKVLRKTAVAPGNVTLAKLEGMAIPKVEMDAVPLGDAWSYVSMCATEHDPAANPQHRGISFLLTGAGGVAGGEEKKPVVPGEPSPGVTFHGKDVRLLELLREIARQGRLDVYVTEVGVVGVPEGVPPFPNGKAKEGEVSKVVRLKRAEEVKRFLDTAVLREVDFKEETVTELMTFLRLCALELDPKRVEAKKKGVSITERRKLPDPGVFVGLGAREAELAVAPRITLSMKDATIGAVLKEMARQGKLDIYLTTAGVLLRPAGAKAFANEKEKAAKLVETIYRYEAPGERESDEKPRK